MKIILWYSPLKLIIDYPNYKYKTDETDEAFCERMASFISGASDEKSQMSHVIVDDSIIPVSRDNREMWRFNPETRQIEQ